MRIKGNLNLVLNGLFKILCKQLLESENITELFNWCDSINERASKIAKASPVKTEEAGGILQFSTTLTLGIQTADPIHPCSVSLEESVSK